MLRANKKQRFGLECCRSNQRAGFRRARGGCSKGFPAAQTLAYLYVGTCFHSHGRAAHEDGETFVLAVVPAKEPPWKLKEPGGHDGCHLRPRARYPERIFVRASVSFEKM